MLQNPGVSRVSHNSYFSLSTFKQPYTIFETHPYLTPHSLSNGRPGMPIWCSGSEGGAGFAGSNRTSSTSPMTSDVKDQNGMA